MVTLWDGNGNNQHTSHHTSHHRLTTQMQMRLYTFIQEDMTVFFEILVKCSSSTCMITWRIHHPGRESDSPIFNWGYIWLDVEIQTEKSCLTQPLHLRSRQEGRGQPCLNSIQTMTGRHKTHWVDWKRKFYQCVCVKPVSNESPHCDLRWTRACLHMSHSN